MVKATAFLKLLEIVMILKSEHFNEIACIKHAQPGKSQNTLQKGSGPH
jgi:hypothetical protein